MKHILLLCLISSLGFTSQTSTQTTNNLKSDFRYHQTTFSVPNYNFDKLIHKISKRNDIPVIYKSPTNKHFNIAIFNAKLSNTDAICYFDFNPVISSYLSGIKYFTGMEHISTAGTMPVNPGDDNIEDFMSSSNPFALIQDTFGYKVKDYELYIKRNSQINNMADISFTFKEDGNPKNNVSGHVTVDMEHNEFIIGLDNNIMVFASLGH